MKISCYSYNIDQKVFDIDYIQQWIQDYTDIIIVSLQELDMSIEGVTQLNKKTERGLQWKENILKLLNKHSDYKCLAMEEMGTVGIYFFCTDEIIQQITSIETHYLPFGIEGSASKGCVCIHCEIGQKSYCFINSHLEAHDYNVNKRNEQYQLIQDSIHFSNGSLMKNDYIFWMGDLNYRVDLDDSLVRELIQQNQYLKLLEYDQLMKDKQEGKVFEGFNEGIISFQPTFKTNINSSGYSLQRTPSYCDRILYSSKYNVNVIKYVSYPNLLGSDHYAISGCFEF